ncbi:hypothetical protein CBL_05862 [Carabus blaptoides fortunei]
MRGSFHYQVPSRWMPVCVMYREWCVVADGYRIPRVRHPQVAHDIGRLSWKIVCACALGDTLVSLVSTKSKTEAPCHMGRKKLYQDIPCLSVSFHPLSIPQFGKSNMIYCRTTGHVVCACATEEDETLTHFYSAQAPQDSSPGDLSQLTATRKGPSHMRLISRIRKNATEHSGYYEE